MLDHRFCELAVRGELAAVHGQQRCRGLVEIDDVITRDAFRVVRRSRQQRTQAGKGPDDVVHAEVALKVPVGHVEQVHLLCRSDRGMRKVAGVFAFRRTDEREVAFVRQREHDAAVGRLEDVREVVVEQLAHDDVAAADHARMAPGGCRRAAVEELRDPRSRRVHHEPGPQGSFAAVGCAQSRDPLRAIRLQSDAGRARQYLGTAFERINGIGHDQSRIVDPAIGVFETRPVTRIERFAGRMPAQVDRLRRRQVPARREVVIQEEAGADHPRRPQVRFVRQHESQRPREMRRGREHHLAFLQRLAHQAEVVVLEVAQSAVDQLGAGGGRVRRQVVLFAEHGTQAAARCIPRNTCAIDAAPDDEDVAAFTHGGQR